MGQLSSGLKYCLSSFLGVCSQIKPDGFKKVVPCWVMMWPGTGADRIDESSLSCICLDKENPFPFNDVFTFSRCVALIHISGCLSAGALWTLHHSCSHDALTLLLGAEIHIHAARKWKLAVCTEVGRSSCSSLLVGAETGCLFVSAKPIKPFLSLHWCFFSSCLPLPPASQVRKAKGFFCLHLVSDGGKG